MAKTIIGSDPDSSKSGWAVIESGKLTEVNCLTLIEIYQRLEALSVAEVKNTELHIENVNGISAAFNARDRKSSLEVKLKMAQHIGMCKQAQIEIERIAEHFGVKVVRHGVSKMWKASKTGKAALASLGWTGQSNEDSRSAAYFAYRGFKLAK